MKHIKRFESVDGIEDNIRDYFVDLIDDGIIVDIYLGYYGEKLLVITIMAKDTNHLSRNSVSDTIDCCHRLESEYKVSLDIVFSDEIGWTTERFSSSYRLDKADILYYFDNSVPKDCDTMYIKIFVDINNI